MTGLPPPCLVSLHDVMPETLPRVRSCLERLEALAVAPVTLLVVPGRAWSKSDLAWLRGLDPATYPLAAHGWAHRSPHIRGLVHRLHSWLLSRDVAEHLSEDAGGVAALIRRSLAWFPERGLPPPALYVPPAWALGRLRPEDRRTLPCRRIEVTRGIIEVDSGHLARYPLTGYEADTGFRGKFLRIFNAWQIGRAHRSGRPLRLSIHPDDFDLRLSDRLVADLRRGWRFVPYPT
ncbi:MAG: polysaccharide deacetylase family protein [Opitutales bacterium]